VLTVHSSPYVILAHYGELQWVSLAPEDWGDHSSTAHTDMEQAASLGVDADLIRFSVGLEDTQDLVERFERALASISDEDACP
jgi:cystathionine gamma-synthase